LHMPVVQPYRTSKAKTINTYLQRLSLSEPHQSDPVSKRKQLQGFPPNFIHSLDATHMLLSALRCDELGLAFAAVHDSFWTHASDIEVMNGVLRDSFIRIHSEDVVGRLAAEFAARYKDCIYLARIKASSSAYKKIMTWRASSKNCFATAKGSKTPIAKKAPRLDELMLERERMRLLASSDPNEVEQGKKMITPASIYEETASEGDLVEDEIQDLGLGDISARGAGVNDMTSDEHEADVSAAALDNLDEYKDVDADDNPDEPEVIGIFEKSLAPSPPKINEIYGYIWLPLTFPPVPKKVSFEHLRFTRSNPNISIGRI